MEAFDAEVQAILRKWRGEIPLRPDSPSGWMPRVMGWPLWLWFCVSGRMWFLLEEGFSERGCWASMALVGVCGLGSVVPLWVWLKKDMVALWMDLGLDLCVGWLPAPVEVAQQDRVRRVNSSCPESRSCRMLKCCRFEMGNGRSLVTA